MEGEVRVYTRQRKPVRYHLNPIHFVADLWARRSLVRELTRRQIQNQYRASLLGRFWAFATPLATLAVYTFAFSVVLKARWGGDPDESRLDYALTLFTGLILFDLFTGCVGQASLLIVAHTNFVKKVVFPLEVLPIVLLFESLFNLLVSSLILTVALAVVNQGLPATGFLFPLTLIPLIMLTLGISWFLASFGVFMRDVQQGVTICTRLLFFLTPIFYPLSLVPERFQPVIKMNPLTVIVDTARRTLIWGEMPGWYEFGAVTALGFVVMILGYAWFMQTKHGFADIL